MDAQNQTAGNRAILLVCLLFFASFLGNAQGQISVNTTLTRSSVSLGEQVQLQIGRAHV